MWHTPFKVKTINSRIYDQHMKLKEKLNLRDSIVHVLIGKKHQNVKNVKKNISKPRDFSNLKRWTEIDHLFSAHTSAN